MVGDGFQLCRCGFAVPVTFPDRTAGRQPRGSPFRICVPGQWQRHFTGNRWSLQYKAGVSAQRRFIGNLKEQVWDQNSSLSRLLPSYLRLPSRIRHRFPESSMSGFVLDVADRLGFIFAAISVSLSISFGSSSSSSNRISSASGSKSSVRRKGTS